MSTFNFNSPFTIGNPKAGNAHKIQKWESAWVAMVANGSGNISLPSSAFGGQAPDQIAIEIKLTSAGGDYAAGDVIYLNDGSYDNASASSQRYGMTVSLNAANDQFYYKIPTNGYYLWSTIGGSFTITGNADFRIVATKFTIGDQPDITRVGLVPLEKKVVTSGDADVTFNLQQYFNEYESFTIICTNLKNVTDNVQPYFRCSDDGGSTFRAGASDYNTNYHGAANGVSSVGQIVTTAGYVSVATTGTGANEECQAILDLTGFEEDGVLNMVYSHSGGINAAPLAYSFISTTYACGTDVLTDIQFSALTGNLESGSYTLYGKRKVP